MKTKKADLLASVYMEFGNLLLEFDCNDDAVRFLVKSLKLSEEAGENHGIRRSMQSLGKLLLRRGNVELAERFFNRCLEMHEAGNPGYDLLPLLGLIDTYRLTGRYEEALAAADDARKKLPENPAMEPYLCAALSGIFMDTDRYADAISLLDEAWTKEGQETKGEIWIELHSRRAWCYFKLGKTKEAFECFRLALAMAEDKESPYRESSARALLALAVSEGGDPGEAVGHARVALSRAVSTGSELCLTLATEALGKTLEKSGKNEEGLEYLKYALFMARETGHHRDMCAALLAMARTSLDAGRFEEALIYAYRLLHHADIKLVRLRKESLLIIASAYAGMGMKHEALVLVKPILEWAEKESVQEIAIETKALLSSMQ